MASGGRLETVCFGAISAKIDERMGPICRTGHSHTMESPWPIYPVRFLGLARKKGPLGGIIVDFERAKTSGVGKA